MTSNSVHVLRLGWRTGTVKQGELSLLGGAAADCYDTGSSSMRWQAKMARQCCTDCCNGPDSLAAQPQRRAQMMFC